MKILLLCFLIMIGLVIQIHSQQYPRNQVIEAGEFFLTIDPGEGNGTPINASYGLPTTTVIFNTQLTKGSIVYVRFRSSNGMWSSARGCKYTYKNLQAAQYYIKYSNGSQSPLQNMSVSNEPANSPFFIAVSGSIPSLAQDDTVFVRFQSDDYFWSQWSKASGEVVGILNDKSNLPKEFRLYSAYPNPFNPITVIEYDIPKLSDVRLEIYDLLGRNVATLVQDMKAAGKYKIEFNASNLSSGIYFYRMQAGDFNETKKIILIK